MVNLNWQPGMTLESIEKEAILQAFRHFRQNKSATSRALDISVRTLESKLEKYESDDRTAVEHEDKRKLNEENFLRRQRGLPPLDSLVSQSDVDAEEERNRKRGAEYLKRKLGQAPSGESEGDIDAEAEEGLDVQPSQEARAKQPMPLPVREKVQEVPSKFASGSSNRKHR